MTINAKLITLASDLEHPGWLQLKRSLDHFGWNYEVINKPYTFFGSKMVYALEYAKQTDATHLFVIDSYDTFVLGTMEEALDKIDDKDCVLFNGEKGCWPNAELAQFYPNQEYDYKYLNGGALFARTDLLINLLEDCHIQHTENDQMVFTAWFLGYREKFKMKLDVECEVFQSVAFSSEEDFDFVDGRLVNRKTKSIPVLMHSNGGINPLMRKIYRKEASMNTLKEVAEVWQDKEDTHKMIAEYFNQKASEFPELVSLRHFVTENQFGYSEFCHYYMWKLIVDELPKGFKFCEIGVFKSQFLCLVALLAEMQHKYHRHCIFGVSPMNGAEVNIESDYYDDVFQLHKKFNAPTDYEIVEGYSTDLEVLRQVELLSPFNALYIDGGHSFETVTFDLTNYAPLITYGGFLVVDDSGNNFNMPTGYFKGHQSVTDATNAWASQHPEFVFLFNCSHNRVYKKT